MHIPDEMLKGSICPLSVGLSILGIGFAALAVVKLKRKLESLKHSDTMNHVPTREMLAKKQKS